MKSVVTFGEVMTRFRPPGFKRIAQSFPGTLEVSFAGAEANVAASIALLGGHARFVTSLPRDPIADACVGYLRALGIDTSAIVRSPEGRIGAYYIELGANQRAGRVVYDRAYSAITLQRPDAYDWDRILEGADWLHVTGITPALSETAARATIEAVQHAKRCSLTVSCDLNFRAKLWRWERGTEPRVLARRTMERVLPHVDLVIANEADADDVLGIRAGQTVVESGTLHTERYPDVARRIVERFTNVATVAITLRESVSASHNRWGAMLFDTASDAATFAPWRDGRYLPNEITQIVDRVGAGDSFGAALITALRDPEFGGDRSRQLSFAVAASTLAHSIDGDINLVGREEIAALSAGNASGRVQR